MHLLDIKTGDVVWLNSDGPAMTVVTFGIGFVRCFWFNEGEVREAQFPPEALRNTDPATTTVCDGVITERIQAP